MRLPCQIIYCTIQKQPPSYSTGTVLKMGLKCQRRSNTLGIHTSLENLNTVLFLIGRIHESGNQGVEAGAALIILTPNDPLRDFMILTAATMG